MAKLLNLAEAEGFDPLPPGTYVCEVFSHEMAATKGGENAKLPAGTPMIKIQFKVISDTEGNTEVDDEGTMVKLENRRVFGQWVVPPAEIDGEPYKHYKMMNGTIVGLMQALGYEKAEIQDKKGFDPDLDEKIGTQVLVTVGRDLEFNSNPVKRVRAATEAVGAGLL